MSAQSVRSGCFYNASLKGKHSLLLNTDLVKHNWLQNLNKTHFRPLRPASWPVTGSTEARLVGEHQPEEYQEVYDEFYAWAPTSMLLTELRGHKCDSYSNERTFWTAAEKFDLFSSTEYRSLPWYEPGVVNSPAVVINCEVVETEDKSTGDGATARFEEVVQIVLVDYLTGERLMDNLVEPQGRVVDWRTHVHGVDGEAMERAVAEGTAYTGVEEVCAALADILDADSVVIGHNLGNVMNLLDVKFDTIIDTELLAWQRVTEKLQSWFQSETAVQSNRAPYTLLLLSNGMWKPLSMRPKSRVCEQAYAIREVAYSLVWLTDGAADWIFTKAAIELERGEVSLFLHEKSEQTTSDGDSTLLNFWDAPEDHELPSSPPMSLSSGAELFSAES